MTGDANEITLMVVKLRDGSRGYQLPNGTVITEEGWKNMDPAFRSSVIREGNTPGNSR